MGGEDEDGYSSEGEGEDEHEQTPFNTNESESGDDTIITGEAKDEQEDPCADKSSPTARSLGGADEGESDKGNQHKRTDSG